MKTSIIGDLCKCDILLLVAKTFCYGIIGVLNT